MGKLTAIAVKAALANPGTYQDGEGLFLTVDKRGGSSWFLRWQRDGNRHDIGLGSDKLQTLAEARETLSGLPTAEKVERGEVRARGRHGQQQSYPPESASDRIMRRIQKPR